MELVQVVGVFKVALHNDYGFICTGGGPAVPGGEFLATGMVLAGGLCFAAWAMAAAGVVTILSVPADASIEALGVLCLTQPPLAIGVALPRRADAADGGGTDGVGDMLGAGGAVAGAGAGADAVAVPPMRAMILTASSGSMCDKWLNE